MPKFAADGTEYTYTVDAVKVSGYSKQIEGNTITNSLEGNIDIPFKKVWIGAPEILPTITINLLADGQVIDSVTIENGESLVGVFENYPVFDNTGKKIEYTVTEEISENADAYRIDIKQINGTWMIKNTYIDKVSIPVSKIWQYSDGTEMPDIPSEITKVFVVLYRNDESFAVKELRRDNGWSTSFEGLDRYGENGALYNYRIEELPVDGFEGSLTTNDDGSVSIVNRKKDTLAMSIPVQKLWDGENPTDIGSVTIVLTRDGDDFTRELELTAPSWNGEFAELPRVDKDGNKYNYKVEEKPIPGYEASYNGGGTCGFVILNSPTTGSEIFFTKLAAGTNTVLEGAEFELRGITNPSYSQKATSGADGKVYFSNLPYGEYALTETIAPQGYERNESQWTVSVARDGTVTIDGSSWEEFTVENQILKGAVELTKTLEGRIPQSNQTATFELYKNGDVKIGDYITDQYGKIQVNNLESGDYYFKEILAPEGYELNETPIEFTIQGTLNEVVRVSMDNKLSTTSIYVEKSWVGGNERPEVEVQLFRQVSGGNKEFVGEGIRLNDGNEWKHIWTDLDMTDSDGDVYTYSVDEINVPTGYSKSIKGTGTELDPFVITNTYGTDKTDITVIKEWIGGPSPKPEIELQLLRNIEGEDPQSIDGVENITLSDGEISYTWTGMDLTDNDGNIYTYSVREINVPQGYTVSYNGLKVTNTFTDTVGLQILKTDESGNPLEFAKFGLFERDGTTLIDEQNSFIDGKILFTGLEPGKQYVIREILAPEGYIISNERYTVNVDNAGVVEVIGNSGVLDSNPLVIRNKKFIPPEPETVNIVVHKTWANLLPGDSADNHTAKFVLSPTGEEREITGNGTVVFENLPKYDESSNIIEYTVTESPIDGFETITAGNMNDGFVFTNYPTAKFGVVLQKTDERTKAVLEGAEFELWGKVDEGRNRSTSTTESNLELESLKAELESKKAKLEELKYSNEPSKDLSIKIRRIEEIEKILNESPEEETVTTTSTENSLNSQMEILKTQVMSTIEEFNSTTRNRIEKVQSEISRLNGEIRTSENRDVLENEIIAKQIELETLLAQESALASQMESIREQMESLSKEIQDLDAKPISSTNERDVNRIALTEELEKLKSEVQNSSESKDNSEEISKLENEIVELEKAITNTVTESENSDVGMLGNDYGMNDTGGYTLIGTYTTDEWGLIAIGDLRSGDYYFKEIKAPEGYIGDLDKKYEFSVPDSEIPSKPIVINVTNKEATIPTTEYTVHKVWSGGPLQHPTIRIQLYKNEEIYGAEIQLENGTTSYTWNGLPKFEGTVENIYTAKEVEVPEYYDVTYNGNVITNTWNKEPEPEEILIEGVKNWVGDVSSDRPSTITIELYKDGNLIETLNVGPDSEGNWKYSFGNQVLKETDGTIHNYYIVERRVPSYEPSYSGFNITNTKKQAPVPDPVFGNISGQKTWRNDTESQRPGEILVYLIETVSGRVVQSQRVQKDNGWRYEFKNVLLKDQRGIEYNYRIEEERVPGYKPIYSGYNIINEREMGAPVDPEDPEIPWEPYPPYDPTTPPVEPDKPILPVDPDKEVPPKDWTDSDVIEPEKPEPQTPEVPEPVKPDELEPIKPDDSVSEKPKESSGTVYTNKKEKSDPSKVNPKTLVEGYTTHIAAMVLAAITFVYADIKRRKNR